MCNGLCVSLSTDPFHCGACDNVCDGGTSCSQGNCLACGQSPLDDVEAVDIGASVASGSLSLGIAPLIVDVNGDGWLDVVATESGASRIALVYGGPTGLANEPVFVESALGAGRVLLTDMNSDGRLDLVALGTNQIAINRGLRTGDFASPLFVDLATESPYSHPIDFGVGDFDADERMEIAVLTAPRGHYRLPTEVSILWSLDSPLEFEQKKLFSEDFSSAFGGPAFYPRLQLGDFSHNGELDVALFSRKLFLLEGDGAGSFVQHDDWTNAPESHHYPLAFFDWDGDSRQDVIGARLSGQGTLIYGFHLRLAQAKLNGDFTFFNLSETVVGSSRSPHLQLLDVSEDGLVDAFVRDSGVIWQYDSTENGFSGRPTVIKTGGDSRDGFALEDMNQDGQPDLVLNTAGLLQVLPQSEEGFESLYLNVREGIFPRDVRLHSRSTGDPARIVGVGSLNQGGLWVFNPMDGELVIEEEHSLYRPDDFQLADVDGDGVKDAVVRAEQNVYLLRGADASSEKWFESPVSFLDRRLKILLLDGDGDGRSEVLSFRGGYSDPSLLQISRYEGSGFEHTELTLSGWISAVAAGDFDGDGRQEVAWVIERDGADWVQWVRLSGGVVEVLAEHEAGWLSNALVPIDFDGDGLDELVVASSYGGQLLLGRGIDGGMELLSEAASPGFGAQAALSLNTETVLSETPALLVPQAGRLHLWRRDAANRLERQTTYYAPGAERVGGLADINGDGFDDLLVAGGSEYNLALAILWGRPLCSDSGG